MSEPAEKLSLHSYLRERYGSSTQKLVREYERCLHKQARFNNHHIFNLRCRDEGVIPSSLKIVPPVRTAEGYRIAERASRAFLKARVHETYRSRRELASKVSGLRVALQHRLPPEDFRKVSLLSAAAAEKTHAKTKLNQVQKLGKLTNTRDKRLELPPQEVDRWVVNLTDRSLSEPQKEVLRLGLNFAPAPTKLPLVDTIAAVEEGAQQLKEEDAEDLRGRVCGILRHAKPPKDNLTKEQRRALKELRGLEDEVILPADKGNATVVMTREDYNTKMRGMLETATYQQLKKDPTAAQERKLTSRLGRLKKEGEIPESLYQRLRPSGSQLPRIYGLPKIHKPEVPLRPIVACIGAPSYKLSKYITSLISPLAGRTDSHVKNSKHFVEMMSGLRIEDDEMLVSFDVSSLFTNVPVDEAVRVIHDRLQNDVTLCDRTTLSPDRVAELLEVCLRSTYFCYGGTFYEQQEGAAMGSPVSAAVANLYMEFFEDLALRSAPVTPRLWKRYVDDTCCIVKKGTVEALLGHLNSVRPSIKFTVEVEKDGTLPFLDTLLQRKGDGSLDVTVYRKPTHTDRYLDFQSHHPPHVKRGLVRCLFDRARSVTSSQDNLQKEERHLAKVLKQNGYPGAFIQSARHPPQREDPQDPLPGEGDRPPLVVLPYTAGVSENIRRVCQKFGMKVVFRSSHSLRSMLTKVKDAVPMEKQANVVYRIPCSCGKSYIGETKRRLESRLKEHQDACRTQSLHKSAVAEHAWGSHHPINWNDTSVVDRARRPEELLLKEAIHIQNTPAGESLNRDGGKEIPKSWMITLKHSGGAVNRRPGRNFRRQSTTSGDTR